jgi:hypothetical protein
MADIKISALPAGTTPAGTEEIPLVQGGITKKVTVSQILGTVPADQVTSVDTRTGEVSLADRYVSVTGGSVTGSLNVSSFVAVGTNPAQSGAIRLANAQWVTARNAANDADLTMLRATTANRTQVNGTTGGTVDIAIGGSPVISWNPTIANLMDGYAFNTGATTGFKLASTAAQKLGFYGAAPVVRPTGTPAAATDPATTMALVNSLRASLIALGLIS